MVKSINKKVALAVFGLMLAITLSLAIPVNAAANPQITKINVENKNSTIYLTYSKNTYKAYKGKKVSIKIRYFGVNKKIETGWIKTTHVVGYTATGRTVVKAIPKNHTERMLGSVSSAVYKIKIKVGTKTSSWKLAK